MRRDGCLDGIDLDAIPIRRIFGSRIVHDTGA
jgi:hypothetical protein